MTELSLFFMYFFNFCFVNLQCFFFNIFYRLFYNIHEAIIQQNTITYFRICQNIVKCICVRSPNDNVPKVLVLNCDVLQKSIACAAAFILSMQKVCYMAINIVHCFERPVTILVSWRRINSDKVM